MYIVLHVSQTIYVNLYLSFWASNDLQDPYRYQYE